MIMNGDIYVFMSGVFLGLVFGGVGGLYSGFKFCDRTMRSFVSELDRKARTFAAEKRNGGN